MKQLMRVVRGVAREVRSVAMRAEVSLNYLNRKLSTVQVDTGDVVVDELERFQDYGLASIPIPGAECVMVKLGLEPVIIATDDRRYRVQGLEQGDVAIYDFEGQEIVLRRSGIHINAKEVRVATNVVVEGSLTASQLQDATGSLATLRDAFLSHVHSLDTGTTSTPIEV